MTMDKKGWKWIKVDENGQKWMRWIKMYEKDEDDKDEKVILQ